MTGVPHVQFDKMVSRWKQGFTLGYFNEDIEPQFGHFNLSTEPEIVWNVFWKLLPLEATPNSVPHNSKQRGVQASHEIWECTVRLRNTFISSCLCLDTQLCYLHGFPWRVSFSFPTTEPQTTWIVKYVGRKSLSALISISKTHTACVQQR